MENVCWNNRVRSREVLRRVNEERNSLLIIKKTGLVTFCVVTAFKNM